MTQIDNMTYVAYPHVPRGYSTTVYIYGRMNDPQSLGNPSHIIRTLNGGSSFELIEDNWSTDWCGSFFISLRGDSFAVRSRSGGSKLYKDNADNNFILKVSTSFDAPVYPHGMLVDELYNYVYLCSGSADPVMVLMVKYPYFTFSDLTFDHDNTEGIKAIVKL